MSLNWGKFAGLAEKHAELKALKNYENSPAHQGRLAALQREAEGQQLPYVPGMGPEAQVQEPEMVPEIQPEIQAPVIQQSTPEIEPELPSQPEAPIMDTPVEQTQPDYISELETAQARQNQQDFVDNMLRAGTTIGSALAYQKPDYTAVDALQKQNALPVQNLKDKMKTDREQRAIEDEKMLRDPKSEASKAFQDVMKKLGIPFDPEKTSAFHAKALGINPQNFIMQEKANESRERIARERTQAMKREGESFADKEQIKEDVKVRTENRKELKNIEKDMQSTENLLKDLQDTEKMFNKYSKGSLLGTGPVATLGGLTKYVSSGSQDLDAQFKKMNLDTMVKMFAGMSKAVDSDAERRAFESAQPSLSNDDNVNRRLLKERIEAAKSLLAKQKAAVSSIDKRGNFVEGTKSQAQSPVTPGKIRVSDGNETMEIDTADEAAAAADGFKRIN